MKKTLIILLSLAGVSIAGEPIWVSNSVPSTYTLDSSIFTTGSLSIAMRLDVEKLAAKSAANFSGSQKIVELNGLWNNANKEGLYNVNLNGSSDYDTSTLYMGLLDPKYNSTYSHNQSLGSELSGTNIFTTATDWSQICRASLVVTKTPTPQNGDTFSVYFTLSDQNGNTTVYSGSKSGLKYSNFDHDGNDSTATVSTTGLNVTEINFFGQFSTYAEVYNIALDEAAAKKLGAKLAPEPTTATLSLLALAGLVVRRRRK